MSTTQAAPTKRALIVVDVQNDFCEGGSLAVPGGAAIAGAVSDYVDRRGDAYAVIVATRDWHHDPGAHFAAAHEQPNFVDTWPVHCRAGSHGAAFHADLRLPARTVVVTKGEHAAAFSGFQGHDPSGTALADLLTAASVDAVDVVGLATSFCDRSTALDGVRHGFITRLIAELCADVAGADTGATFSELAAAGVDVVAGEGPAERRAAVLAS